MICRIDDAPGATLDQSTEAIDRYMQSGLGEALEQANFPEPQITDFEVHKLDWAD